MRLLACAIGVALVACQDGGVVIIVDPQAGMGVNQVRIYIGRGPRTQAGNLTTDQGGADNVGYWTRDPNNALDAAHPDTTDGSVGFTLVHTDTDTLPVVIAVGFKDNTPVGEAVKLDIPIPHDNVFHAYHFTLHGPVSPLDQPSPHELALWSPLNTVADPTAQACAGAVITSASGDPTRAFVVTENDQDCDGYLTGDPLECDPNVFDADRPAIAGELACLAPTTNPAGCFYGGPHCKDGVGRMGPCEATNYCVPTELCAACGTSLACAADPARGGNVTITGYRCAIDVDGNGDVCDQALALERPPTGGWDCTGATISDATKPFGPKLDAGSFSAEVKFDPSCAVQLIPQGHLPTNPLTALLAFDLANGNGLGLPITLATKPAAPCGAETIMCVLDPVAYNPELTRCMAEWNAPVPVAGLGPADRALADPSLTKDEQLIYYTLTDSVNTHIMVATWDPNTNTWTNAHAVAELGSAGSERAPNISADGLRILFASDRNAAGVFDLWEAKRADISLPFSALIMLAPNVDEAAPNEDLTHAIVAVNNAGTGLDLEEVLRPDPASTSIMPGPPMPSDIDGPSSEVTPFLSNDGLQLYFSSDRNSVTGLHKELYVSSRNTLSEPFGRPVALVELGSAGADVSPWVSADNHRIYFSSDRGTPATIYMATR